MTEKDERHAARMQRKKAVVDQKIGAAGIATGRAAPQELVAVADTVTDMTLIKHAFQNGVQAMPGIEW